MYDQNGNYIAFAGLAVMVLAKFGVTTDVATLMSIVGGIIGLIGIIKQYRAHKNLAIMTGNIIR